MAVKNNQKGQALFELIIFLPLFLYMVKVLFDYGDAINNSINQLKVVRGYYFYTISNDSNAPNRLFSKTFYDRGISGNQALLSLDAYSWSLQSTVGDVRPIGSCVKVSGFLGGENNTDECASPNVVEEKTQFIRAYSAFGVCTGTWINVGSGSPLYALNWVAAASAPCIISN